eukprot:jgi/Botrbrau1/14082/Bobra.182_3s0029.1
MCRFDRKGTQTAPLDFLECREGCGVLRFRHVWGKRKQGGRRCMLLSNFKPLTGSGGQTFKPLTVSYKNPKPKPFRRLMYIARRAV